MKVMREPKKDVLRLGILAVLIGILCTPLVPSASGQTAPEEQPAAAQGILQATPWGTPVLVSPNSGTALSHFPRTTTLAWQPVFSAISYVVERAYLSGTTWYAYPPVTVSGNSSASYTFDFIGDQKGRWRVTAFNGITYSTPSAWWILVQHQASNGHAHSDKSCFQRNLRPLPADPHAVMENGACGGGLQTRDSVLHG